MVIDIERIRLVLALGCGGVALIFGVLKNNAAMMTIGAGLVGFSPAAKGPVK